MFIIQWENFINGHKVTAVLQNVHVEYFLKTFTRDVLRHYRLLETV